MKAFIFNSGLGNRMEELTKSNHKSMVKLSTGETIFQRQIRILSECGIKDFIVTVGYLKEQLIHASKSFPQLNFVFVENAEYASTNYIYSMYLASRYLDSDMLFLHGDLVFNKRLVVEILNNENNSICLYNEEKQLPKKDFKGRIQNGSLKEVSVHIFDHDCFAFQPFYKLSKDVVISWREEVEKFIKNGNNQVYAENALNTILDKIEIKAVSYKENYIEEIDDINDFNKVTEEIRYCDYREQDICEFNNLGRILKDNPINKILIVTSDHRDDNIKNYLAENKYNFICFHSFSSNPKYEEIKKGIELFQKEKCDFIISIGGGSCIDTAKSIKLLSALENELDFLDNKFHYSSVKHLAVPTTAGTGSESTRFAVMYYKGEKVSLTQDSILPEYVILDYEYLVTLPDYFKKTTMLDALCQAIESYWSKGATFESKEYSISAIKLILENYKGYLNNRKETLQKMFSASNLSGKAINITTTTAPHAMSYKLTSLYGISHGHGVGLSLSAVWRHMYEHIEEYKEQKEKLLNDFTGLAAAFGCETIEGAVFKFEKLYKSLNLDDPKVLNKEDIEILVRSVNMERLKNHPVLLSEIDIEQIYNKILVSGG